MSTNGKNHTWGYTSLQLPHFDKFPIKLEEELGCNSLPTHECLTAAAGMEKVQTSCHETADDGAQRSTGGVLSEV